MVSSIFKVVLVEIGSNREIPAYVIGTSEVSYEVLILENQFTVVNISTDTLQDYRGTYVMRLRDSDTP